MCGVYKITNLINKKIYIGISIDIKYRWYIHKLLYTRQSSPEYNKPLYAAMRKYGIDNFSFEVIEECDVNDLSLKEKEYIKLYDCCRLDGIEKGYNLTRGGEGYYTTNYEEIFTLWSNGMSQKNICNTLHISEGSVIRALNMYGVSSYERHSRSAHECKKSQMQPVIQYDKNGNKINEFESMTDAHRQTGVDLHDIKRVCCQERKSAGGYVWRYKT